MMIQTDLELVQAVFWHASRALSLTVAHRWAHINSFKKSERTCRADIARLKRNGTPEAHLAIAAIEELLRRRKEKCRNGIMHFSC